MSAAYIADQVLVCSVYEQPIQPLLPPASRRPKGDRPRPADRACFAGILFVLRQRHVLGTMPRELGCGSGMTGWRRLRDWQQRGVWDLVHVVLLDWLAHCGRIDWSRAVVDASSRRMGTRHWHVQWYAVSLRSLRQTRARRGGDGYNQQYNPEGEFKIKGKRNGAKSYGSGISKERSARAAGNAVPEAAKTVRGRKRARGAES
jgi:transposase